MVCRLLLLHLSVICLGDALDWYVNGLLYVFAILCRFEDGVL